VDARRDQRHGGEIAVKVISHYGDEVLKVYEADKPDR
jgi:hypothetical protein